MSLYPILQKHALLLDEIEQAEGEVSEEMIQQFELNGIEIQRNALSLGYGIKALEDKEQAIKRELDRLKSLYDATVNKKERIKEYLSNGMQQAGIEKVKGDTLELSFRKSEKVVIENEKIIPQRFKTLSPQVWTVSKNAIKDALKDSIDVPGAKLIINQNLQIK